MQLKDYLDRIGYAGKPRPDLATLRAVHRAHAESIPYENLDVQLGRPVTRAASAAFEKIVGRRRGGWCYEMNGLLGWALEEIGFGVKRLAGGVMRQVNGDDVVGNHLVLLIDLGDIWMADVGFGDGLIEPIPLAEGPFRNGPLQCRLEMIDGGWYRYLNDEEGGAPSFDIHPEVTDEALLEDRCRFLQTDPASPFVQNAVVQRWRNGAHYSLRGKVLKVISEAGPKTRLVENAEAYVATLGEVFDLDLPEASSLWPAICERHDALFSAA